MKAINIRTFILLLLISFISQHIQAVIQESGTISVLNSQYNVTNYYYASWDINTGQNQPVRIDYMAMLYYNDYIEIWDVDSSGNETLLTTLSINNYGTGTIFTTKMTGRAKIRFYTDYYVSARGNSMFPGFTINYLYDRSYIVSSDIRVNGNAVILGKLGIGTYTPKESLDIKGSIRGNGANGALNIKTDVGYVEIGPTLYSTYSGFKTDAPIFQFNKPLYSELGAFSSKTNLFLQTNGVTRMTILNSNGNVGVGTIIPNAKLESVSGVNAFPATSNNTQIGAALRLRGGDNAVLDFGINNINTWIQATDQTKLGQNYNICLNPNGGSVGIGTTTPSANNKLEVVGRLRVNGEIYGSSVLTFQSNDRFDVTTATIPNLNTSPFSMPQYGIAAPSVGGSADLWLSGLNSIKMFTGGNPMPRLNISVNGFVGIGSLNPDAMLTVNGTIHATEVKVDLAVPADYVFKSDYKLMPLNQVEKYVKINSHLPEIPSASEIKKNGLNMGEMQNKLLQKVEELTLYVIEQQKRIEQLEKNQK